MEKVKVEYYIGIHDYRELFTGLYLGLTENHTDMYQQTTTVANFLVNGKPKTVPLSNIKEMIILGDSDE